MRINVYAEELTTEASITLKTVNNVEFYGVRLFLKSPKELHNNNNDDDRSAITLWIPYTKKEGNSPQIVIDLLRNMLTKLITQALTRGNPFTFQENELFKGIINHEGL